jgi:hypothetical protein
MPRIYLHPCAEAASVTRPERPTGVADGEAVDVTQFIVLVERSDPSQEADVATPVFLVENCQRYARVTTHESQP